MLPPSSGRERVTIPLSLGPFIISEGSILYGRRGDNTSLSGIDIIPRAARGNVVFDALCYKPEGRGLETQLGECILQFI
jgi:hypothetical protein